MFQHPYTVFTSLWEEDSHARLQLEQQQAALDAAQAEANELEANSPCTWAPGAARAGEEPTDTVRYL